MGIARRGPEARSVESRVNVLRPKFEYGTHGGAMYES